MILNLLTTAFRSIKKNKFFSLLNILGLGIGMAVFLLIALYVKFENSYEAFIPERSAIYRVNLEAYQNNSLVMASAENYPGVGPALKEEFPEVQSFARLYNMGYKNNVIITYPDAKPEPIALKQRKFLYADSSFLSMMGYEMLAGDRATALSGPLMAVVSEKCAHLYFGNENPLGKTLHLQDDDFTNELATVTGVFKDLPSNTHLKFDVLFSYKTLFLRGERATRRYANGWARKDMYTFIKLRPGTDYKLVEAKLPAVISKYKPELQGTGQKESLTLQPIADIHLHSQLAEEPETNGNAHAVFFLGLIGLFVLGMAWINYVNLATVRSLERAKEVGVRKVIGAAKSQLMNQFLTEAVIVNLLSVITAWVLATLSLPYFKALSGVAIELASLASPWFILLLLLLWLAGSLLSGIYPAFVLSSFKPIAVLKGKLKHNSKGIMLRRGLVIIQFMASIALIAGTVIVYRQLDYMANQNIGMNISQVLVVERPGISDTSRTLNRLAIDAFQDELKKNPQIENVSASMTIPGKQREFKATVKREDAGSNDSIIVRLNTMDYGFLDVFKMKLIAGRNFSRNFPRDEDTSAIITETTCRLLGFKNPQEAIGKSVSVQTFNWKGIIVGVINDYHQVSFKQALDPSLFFCSRYEGEFYSMRVKTDDLSATLKHVQKSWEAAFPGNPFAYFFLDDYFNRQYENDRKFGKLFTVFSILAIIICSLGLFGLSAYTANQRIKEIGIRKVLGASVTDITTMLSKDFVKLVIVAIVIASPLTWFTMNWWLQDFAYKAEIKWWIFLIAGGIALVIALFTVSFQAIKAAITNPVKSLRTE